MLFDLFASFIEKIIKSDILPKEIRKDLQKELKYYLYLTVSNFNDFEFENNGSGNLNREQFIKVFPSNFNYATTCTVGEALARFDLLDIPNELLSTKLKISNYEKKYTKFSDYISYLSQTKKSSAIHI